MKLTHVRITSFRSVLDSGVFSVTDMTCFVGKNESGKTALLQALYTLNPIQSEDGTYDLIADYPRAHIEDYRYAVQNEEREPARVAEAVFELDHDDLACIEEACGQNVLDNNTLTLSKGYDGKRDFTLHVKEAMVVQLFVREAKLPSETESQFLKKKTFPELIETIEGEEDNDAALQQLRERIRKEESATNFVYHIIEDRIPVFLGSPSTWRNEVE